MPNDRSAVVRENADRVRLALKALGLGAVVSSRPEDVAYLVQPAAFLYRVITEGRLAEVVIVEDDGSPPLLLTMDAYVPYYESVGVRAVPMSEMTTTLRGVAARARNGIGVPPVVPVSLYRDVEEAAAPGQVRLIDPMADARLCKSPAEIALMREVAVLAEAGMRAILDSCNDGTLECEAAAAGELVMRSSGADGLCFSTVVSSGADLGLMRELTSDRPMRTGDWVLVDMGCQRDGYNVEFARSTMIGEPSAHYRDAYRVVLGAQRAAIAEVRAGTPARNVDAAARAYIDTAGFSAYCFGHITGHGIGTGVWEAPTLGPDSDETLKEGMVVAVEPGIFIPGVGGVRVEDIVVVTGPGSEAITGFPVLAEMA